MAIIFELWAQCDDEDSTKRLASHFDGVEFTLLNGRTIRCGVDFEKTEAGTPGFTVTSGLSRYGVRTVQDALEMTETGLRLYHHLKNGPEFRFARVAIEAESIPMTELHEYVDILPDGSRYLSLSCAMREDLYTEIGSPKHFQVFRNGYWWNRYSGETYQPLYSNDQDELNSLAGLLFPS